MYAISMMQPYAWLFCRGYLTIDDRSRSTAIRGPVAIHASKRFHEPYYEFIRKRINWPLPEIQELEYGGIVGVADLVDCLAASPQGAKPDLRRAHFGAQGFHGFVFKNPRFQTLIPYRGNVGFFQVPDDVVTVGARCPAF